MHKILSYLGLAKRAGKIIVGADGVLESLRNQKVYLLIVASDASSATIERVVKKGSFYKTTVIKYFSTEELASAIGSMNPKVIGLTDQGFAKAIISLETERGD